jgi:predicted site-specific integrase-resolvase
MKHQATLKDLDLTIWLTQNEMAKRHNVVRSTVNNWIRRGRIDSLYIPELNTTLVNRLTLTARSYKK